MDYFIIQKSVMCYFIADESCLEAIDATAQPADEPFIQSQQVCRRKKAITSLSLQPFKPLHGENLTTIYIVF